MTGIDNYVMTQYLQNHPGASLQEYVDHLRAEAERRRQEVEDEEKNREEYYEDMLGKHYILNHNGSSYIFFTLERTNTGRFIGKDYVEYNTQSKKFYPNNESHTINPIWLGNPFDGYDGRNRGIKSIRELSDIEWDRLMNLLDEYNQIVEKVKISFGL